MPSFQFRLQRVLEWRQTTCQLEENRLAACLTELHRVEQELAHLQAERLGIERDMISGHAIRACELAALGLYRLRFRQQELELQAERGRRQQAVLDQTVIAQAAQRRLRLVEKLRERRLAEYLHQEDQAIEKLAAEAYLSKWFTPRLQ